MSNQMQQMIKRLTADKKQFFLMVGLLSVMLLLWGRLLLKNVPQTAAADPAGETSQAQTDGESAAMQADDSFALKPTVYVDLPTVAKRDLFLFDKDRYSTTEMYDPAEEDPKQRADLADEAKELEKIRAWVPTLKLQGTTLGNNPSAMINNQVYRLGELINRFKVTRIEPRQIVMKRGGVEITLPMDD